MMEAVPSYTKRFMDRITVLYRLVHFRPRTIVRLGLRRVLLERRRIIAKTSDSNLRLPQSLIGSTSL